MSELQPEFSATLSIRLDGDDSAAEQLANAEAALRAALRQMRDDRVIRDFLLTRIDA